jgi:hypothetical protein
MANTTSYLTIPLSPDRVPATMSSLLDVTALFDPETSLGGASRRDALGAMMRRVVDDQGLAHLDYLDAPASALPPPRIDAAIADLRRLLQRWRDDPREPLRITGHDWPDAADIPALLDEPASLWPDTEDGDDVPYLIAFLKGHLQVLEAAREQGLWVVHARSPEG